MIIVGDFNEDQLPSPNGRILDICLSYGLKQIITKATRVTPTSKSLLDTIMISSTELVNDSGVGDPFCSDHSPTWVLLNFKVIKTKCYSRRVWTYDEGKYDEFRNILKSTDWDNLLAERSIDTMIEVFTNTLISAAKKTIPNKIVTIRPSDPPWMHNEI